MLFGGFHTRKFFNPDLPHFLYPAPCAFFYRIIYIFPNPTLFFLCLLLAIFTVLAIWLYRDLKQRGLGPSAAATFAFVALCTSYPFYFEFNRANIEIFVWGLSAFGVMAFVRNRSWLGAALIGVAGACKGYPYIYLGLLFAKKKYREIVFSCAVGTLINLVATWAIADDFTVGRRGVMSGLAEFRRVYILRLNGTGLDHSIFAFFKRFDSPLPSPTVLGHILTTYLIVAAICAVILYFARIYSMPVINQVIFLTVAAITLPPTSYDYTLMHLYTPWLLLVFLAIEVWNRQVQNPKGLWPAMICFIILLSPQNEIIFHGERLDGQIKCLALTALAIVALRYPIEIEDASAPALR